MICSDTPAGALNEKLSLRLQKLLYHLHLFTYHFPNISISYHYSPSALFMIKSALRFSPRDCPQPLVLHPRPRSVPIPDTNRRPSRRLRRWGCGRSDTRRAPSDIVHAFATDIRRLSRLTESHRRESDEAVSARSPTRRRSIKLVSTREAGSVA